jgi:hypothetical protein
VKKLYLIGIMLLMAIAPAHAADWIIDDSFIGGGYYTDQYPQNEVDKYYQKKRRCHFVSAQHRPV